MKAKRNHTLLLLIHILRTNSLNTAKWLISLTAQFKYPMVPWVGGCVDWAHWVLALKFIVKKQTNVLFFVLWPVSYTLLISTNEKKVAFEREVSVEGVFQWISELMCHHHALVKIETLNILYLTDRNFSNDRKQGYKKKIIDWVEGNILPSAQKQFSVVIGHAFAILPHVNKSLFVIGNNKQALLLLNARWDISERRKRRHRLDCNHNQ